MNEVTRILERIEGGERQASQELLPLVYEELQRLARAMMSREKPGHTLQPTALVHEAFLRLVDLEHRQKWNSRGHFFAAAAVAMRRILVENARRKQRLKHGGRLQRVGLSQADVADGPPSVDLLALDEALARLAEEDPMKAKLVELRFFAGMTVDEAARALGISTMTAKRYWRYARAWLHRELS